MLVEIEAFKTGWYGIRVGLTAEEIESLIQRLTEIRNSGEHFHFRSDWKGEAGVADVEFYVKLPEARDNMLLE